MITLNTENKVSTKIRLEDLYNSDREKIAEQVVRFNNISNTFLKIFNIKPTNYFSTPGRTEISGNHTDHNLGKVIAASINLDSIACVTPVSYTHLRAHETVLDLVCRLLLEKKQ